MTSQAQSYANFDPVSEVRRELESTQQQIESAMVDKAGVEAPSPPVTAEPNTSPARAEHGCRRVVVVAQAGNRRC